MNDQDEKILDTAKAWTVPESRSKEEVWTALEQQMTKSGPKRTSIGRLWYVAAGISLVAVMGVLYTLFFQSTDIKTGIAEMKSIELPDGSLVTLNAESKISYVASSYEQNRRIKLEGEAFFEVKTGGNFVVDLNGVDVAVLGTSFNIYSRSEIKEIKCVTGKVRVSDSQKSVVLHPGYSIESNRGVMETKPVAFESSKAISWKQGKFLFKNEPFTRVVRELEIQYGVTVKASDFGGRYYSGYFDNRNLEKAAKQVFSPMGYSYEILDKEILIK